MNPPTLPPGLPPALPPELQNKAQRVRALLLDVDGVLTDGGLYVGERGEDFKRFHTLDGYGLRLLRQAGFVLLVVSGKDSKALRHRMQTLRIEHLYLGADPKLPVAQAALQDLGLDWDEVAAVGDDWPDAPLLARAGLAFAPAGAHAHIRHLAHYVTQSQAGSGAVREVCDVLLLAKGLYAPAWNHALGAAEAPRQEAKP